MCARTIPAYTKVRGLFDGSENRRLAGAYYKPPAGGSEGGHHRLSKIRGRVTAREKAAPFFFTEDDFLPEGTHPGVAGGTPWENAPSPWMPASSRACMT